MDTGIIATLTRKKNNKNSRENVTRGDLDAKHRPRTFPVRKYAATTQAAGRGEEGAMGHVESLQWL